MGNSLIIDRTRQLEFLAYLRYKDIGRTCKLLITLEIFRCTILDQVKFCRRVLTQRRCHKIPFVAQTWAETCIRRLWEKWLHRRERQTLAWGIIFARLLGQPCVVLQSYSVIAQTAFDLPFSYFGLKVFSLLTKMV